MDESYKILNSTTCNQAGGTLRWLAPELLVGNNGLVVACCNTRATDVYALGIVAYEVGRGSCLLVTYC